MFKEYERAVIALSNYSKYYGIDTEDELVFKEYLIQCKRNGCSPKDGILKIMGESTLDRTSYCLPFIRFEYKIRTTIELSKKIVKKEDILESLPAYLSDPILYSDYEVEIINFDIKDEKVNIFESLFLYAQGKNKIQVTLNISFTKYINIKSDSESVLIDMLKNSIEYIGISKSWNVYECNLITSEDDIIVVDDDIT